MILVTQAFRMWLGTLHPTATGGNRRCHSRLEQSLAAIRLDLSAPKPSPRTAKPRPAWRRRYRYNEAMQR